MPEIRKDPIIQRWVVIAPERANRPSGFVEAPVKIDSKSDPFAEGNEHETTPEVFAFREAGSSANRPGWRVRVVSNQFPALRVEGNLDKHNHGVYEVMNGVGAHEVIIECPHSETNLSRLSTQNIREVLWAYQARFNDLKQDRRLVHAQVFKNQGALAGASLPHAHSQLIATPMVPITIAEEIASSFDFLQVHGRSIFQDLIEQEANSGARVVLDSSSYLAFCPYASRFPFETWIVPKQAGSHFENTHSSTIEELGQVLKTILRKLELGVDDPPYNYVIHTAPFNEGELPHFRWHIEILPRTTQVAGFEWGTGFYINPVFPEEAAKSLRAVSDSNSR